jgi:hypothetical protein
VSPGVHFQAADISGSSHTVLLADKNACQIMKNHNEAQSKNNIE